MANVSSSNGLEKRPKLRFPGFDEPWSESVLGSFLHERNEYAEKDGSYEHATLSKDGIYGKTARYDRDFLVSTENKKYKVTHYNDLCYNPANLKFGVICLNKYGDAIFSPIYVTFEVSEKVDVDFIGAYLTRWDFINRALRFQQGTVYERMAVSPEDFLSIRCYLPLKKEQIHISSLIRILDKRIEKQQRFVDALKKYKRGVMRSIFRDKTILFTETTKWKTIRLGNECAFFSGGTPKSTNSRYYGGTIPFIRSGEIHGEKTELFLTDDGLKCSSAKMVSKGDLIVALYGATSGEVDISKIDGAINQAILCIRPTWINRVYLKYLLEDRKDDILNTYLQGGQGNLSAEIIKNLIFDIPDESSQLVVVDFLNIVDQHINSSIMLMENLITFRSGLMQQLFI